MYSAPRISKPRFIFVPRADAGRAHNSIRDDAGRRGTAHERARSSSAAHRSPRGTTTDTNARRRTHRRRRREKNRARAMSTPDDVPDDAKQKDIPSVLPLAPGGVYAVKWETRVQRAEPLKITPVAYAPPYPVNEANPRCFFEVRAGGYYLGEVVFEIKEDRAPITANNFVQLCEYHCYAGTMFQVYPSNWIVGGDFTKLDEVVYNAADPDFFDFETLLPDAMPGGQSIYGAYFDDENYDLKHTGAGVLTMHNNGGEAPGQNGSKFMITLDGKSQLDNRHVAFGQVIEGFDILYAIQKLGDARQEGETYQRVTVERCGVRKPSSVNVQASASRASTKSPRAARATSIRQNRYASSINGSGRQIGRQFGTFSHACM